MKNLVNFFVVAILLVGATAGMGYAQNYESLIEFPELNPQGGKNMTAIASSGQEAIAGIIESSGISFAGTTLLQYYPYVLAASSDGNELFTLSFNATVQNQLAITSIKYAPNGDIMVLLNFRDTFVLAGTTYTAMSTNNETDAIFAIYNSNGVFIDAEQVGGDDFVYLWDVVKGSNGKYYLSGTTYGTVYLGSTQLSSNTTVEKVFWLSLNSNLTSNWFKLTGNGGTSYTTISPSLEINSLNELFAATEFNGTLDLENGISLTSFGSGDWCFSKFNGSNGNCIAAYQLGGLSNDEDDCYIWLEGDNTLCYNARTNTSATTKLNITNGSTYATYSTSGTSGDPMNVGALDFSTGGVFYAGFIVSNPGSIKPTTVTSGVQYFLTSGGATYTDVFGNNALTFAGTGEVLAKVDITTGQATDVFNYGNSAETYGVLGNSNNEIFVGLQGPIADVDPGAGTVSIAADKRGVAKYDCNPVVGPTADFSADNTLIEEGQSVTYTDLSSDGTNSITSWDWTFEGGTPGTYSGQNPPAISYATAGTYDATLVVSDGSLSDTEVKTDYITVTAPPPSLSVNPTFEDVSEEAGNVYPNIIANVSWTVENVPNWMTVTPMSGTGDQELEVSYVANLLLVSRSGTFDIVSTETDDVTFTVNQDGVDDYVILTPNAATVPANAGTTTFAIDCADDAVFDITGLGSWVSASPLSGTGPATITLTYDENTDPNSRFNNISVSTNTAMAVFTLTQVGAGAPLEASASSDKPVYTTGQTAQLFGSAVGGTGSYSYEWTGTGGFTSTEQNPTAELFNEGHYIFTLIVNDGENTDTDEVEVDVFDVGFFLDVNPLSGTTDDTYSFYSEIEQDEDDNRTVTYHSVDFGDGQVFESSGNIVEVDHVYDEPGTYDIEQSYVLSDGSTGSYTSLGIIDVTVGVYTNEFSQDNINIYPNPTSGNLFISTGKSIEKLSVINGFGSEVFHQENLGETTQIDLSSLPDGFYFVRILSNGVFTTHKVVKR